MRALLGLFISVLLISCSTGTLFDDELRDIVEFLRLQMRCGYEPAGIPPLAPYQKDFKTVDFHNSKWDILGNFTDLIITGLDEFDVRELYFNNVFQRVKYDLNFGKIIAKGDYKMDLITRELGPAVHIFGDGDMQLTLTNLRAYGTFKFRPTLSGGVKIYALKVNLELENANAAFTGIQNSKLYTKLFNQWIEEFLDIMINDNPDEVSDILEALILPPMNKTMKKITAVELLALILGLAGDIIPYEPWC